MATVLNYNGFTGLTSVQIDSWESRSVLAEDDLTTETTENMMSGTALISGTSAANFKSKLDEARAKLTRSTGDLTFSLNGTTFVSISAPDERGGPTAEFKITKIAGALSAIVAFDIKWHKFEVPSGSTLNPKGFLSHRWTQRFAYDVNGTCTQTVTGILRVRQDLNAAAPGQIDTGSNPDAWRLSVMPQLPNGFRRESMEFAESEDRTKLIYTVVNRQHHRDIPHPATSGDGDFTWRRDIESASGMIGVKQFSAELVGNRNTSLAAILTAAVEVSKKRITYTGANADLITSMEIVEASIFSEMKVRFTVTAKAVGASFGNALQPANTQLLNNLVDGLQGYKDQSPYGSALIRGVRRSLTAPTDSNAVVAESYAKVEESAEGVKTTAYVFPDSTFEQLSQDLIPVSDTTVGSSDQNDAYLYDDYRASIKVHVRSGMKVLSSMSLNVPDHPFQMHKPIVLIEESASAQRRGQPINRLLFAPEDGVVVLDQRSHTETAGQDAAGNVIFRAHAYRLSRVMDIGQKSWETRSSPAGGSYRQWWEAHISAPYDPRIDNALPQVYEAFDDNNLGNSYFGEPDPLIKS